MPYIMRTARTKIDPYIDAVAKKPGNVGELNYVITRIIDSYIRRNGLGYAGINAVIGVLECVKAEYYRRVAGPYEDTKKAQNGDVYG